MALALMAQPAESFAAMAAAERRFRIGPSNFRCEA
jgi:hypothetical protein